MERLKWLIYGCCCWVLLQTMPAEAGAVSVADDARNTGDEEQGLSQQAIEQAQADAELTTAQQELVKAGQTWETAQQQAQLAAQSVIDAEHSVIQAKIQLDDAEKQARLAAVLADKVKADAVAAQTDADLARQKADNALQRAEIASQSAQTDEQDAKVARDYQLADALDHVADAKLDQADALSDRSSDAAQAALDARERFLDSKDAWQDGLDHLTDVKVSADDAVLTMMDAQQAWDEAKKFVEELRGQRGQSRPSQSFRFGHYYYYWHDDKGNHGDQFVLPYSFYYVDKHITYGLDTAYISASNSTAGASGHVAAWGDTVLSASYQTDHKKFLLGYRVAVNLPTGKSKLVGDEKNAVMDDDLVQQSTFGEGFNVTPEVSISYPIGREDSWSLAMNYSWRGKYTQDGDLANAEITPGDIWGQRLRWQHIGAKWQFVGEVNHFSYTDNQLAGRNDYRQGDEWDTSFTYNRELGRGKNVMLYYRNIYDQPYTVYDPVLPQQMSNNSIISHYCGLMWSNHYDRMHTLRLSGDFMKRNGSTFDPHTNLYIDGRRKYTVGIGYDVAWTPQRKLSLDVQRFYMKNGAADDPNRNTGYHGYYVFLRFLINR